MALSPELRKLLVSSDRPKGIIPFEPFEWSERDELIFQVAEMISKAAQGPGIRASDLAEQIVHFVESAAE